MLLKLLTYMGLPPTRRLTQPQMSTRSRLRDPALLDKDRKTERLSSDLTSDSFGHSSPSLHPMFLPDTE